MEFTAYITTISASIFLAICALAFLKARDVFSMSSAVMISNCYIVPLFLIGIGIEKFSWLSSAKILAFVLLNLLISNLLCYTILRHATANKVVPDALVFRGGGLE